MRSFFAYAVAVLLVTCLSCTKDVGTVNLGNYPDDIDQLMNRKCATSGCHNAASAGAANGLNLETWTDLFKGSGSGSPVIPFSSRFSSLCYFINTYQDLGPINSPTMPFNKTPLSYEEVKMVKDWIDAGAKDKNGNVSGSSPTLRKLYAVNQGCDVVTVMDANTQLPIRFVEVGTGKSTPHQVRVSPDGQFWYVLFLNRNVMKKFRCSDDSFVGDIPLTPQAAGTGTGDALDWNTFVITRDGKRAYCVSWTALGSVATVDLEKMKLIRWVPGLNFPHGICLSQDETQIYVAAQTGNYITRIDSTFDPDSYLQISLNNDGIKTASSLDAHDMQLSPDGKYLWLTLQKTNQVMVFDLQAKQAVQALAAGLYPQEIVYSKKYNSYYVSYSGDGTSTDPGGVMRISASDYSVTKLRCGAQPHGIAVDDDRDLLYLLSRNISSSGPIPHHSSQCTGKNGFMNIIDLKAMKLSSRKYELSVDPYFIYIRP